MSFCVLFSLFLLGCFLGPTKWYILPTRSLFSFSSPCEDAAKRASERALLHRSRLPHSSPPPPLLLLSFSLQCRVHSLFASFLSFNLYPLPSQRMYPTSVRREEKKNSPAVLPSQCYYGYRYARFAMNQTTLFNFYSPLLSSPFSPLIFPGFTRGLRSPFSPSPSLSSDSFHPLR